MSRSAYRSCRGDPVGGCWLFQRSREGTHCRLGLGDKCSLLADGRLAGTEDLLLLLAFLEGVNSQSEFRPLPTDVGPFPTPVTASLSESLLCVRW